MTDKEATQMALDAMELLSGAKTVEGIFIYADQEIEALRTALAQPEPVAWADKYYIEREGHDFWVSRQKPARDGVPLYTAPKREWVGLTVEEVAEAGKLNIEGERMLPYSFARAIEAKLKEKNT